MNTNENKLSSSAELLDRAERRIAALEARLARLEESSPVARSEQSDDVATLRSNAPVAVMEEVSSRRGLFKVAGAVASAAVAHSLLSAAPAAAAPNDAWLDVNSIENTTSTTGVSMTPGAGNTVAFQATNLATAGSADGVRGVSDSKSAAGVAGSSFAGYGVYGVTDIGYALYSEGRFGLGKHLSSPGPPLSGNYELGDIIRDNVGNIYACVGAGSAAPNATTPAVFRKVAGPASAGQFHASPVARRAYDCRSSEVTAQRAAQGGEGVFVSGTTRTVNLGINYPGTSEPLVPAGATAAMVTIAVFGIRAEGFFTLYPTGTSAPSALHAYWGGVAGTQTSTLTVVKLDSARRFEVKSTLAGGPDVSAAIDVVGYYL